MGGSGKGSSGKVDWPDYLKSVHYTFLSSEGVDVLGFSCVEMLNDTTSNPPFATLSAYSGTIVIGVVETTAASAIASSLARLPDPVAQFQYSLGRCKEQISLDLTTGISSLEKQLDVIRPSLDINLGKGLLDDVVKGSAFSSTSIFNRPTTLNTWLGEAISKADPITLPTLQRSSAIVTDTLFLVDCNMALFGLDRQAYGMAVEMVKLDILNQREYATQNMDQLSTAAHWNLTQYQVMANGIAAVHGGIPINKQPKFETTRYILTGGLSAQHGDTGMSAARGATMGAMVGSYFGPWGTVVGAVVGAIAGAIASLF